VVAVTLDVDLEPRAPRLTTRGRYVLENRTGAPLTQLHVRALNPNLELGPMTLDGARLTRDMKDYKYRIFTFDRPMAPGEQRVLTFTTVFEQRGFRNSDNMTEIVENGTFVNNFLFAPVLGMDQRGLLQDRNKRRRLGLTPDLRRAKLEDLSAQRHNELRVDWVRSDITVTTDADQTPVAPGYRVQETVRNGRRTARFVSEAPIANFFSIQSARYAVRRDRVGDVELAIYHDPRHGRNVPRMLTAMKAALGYFPAVYGPYQFRQARIIEFPAYEVFAQAFAGRCPTRRASGSSATSATRTRSTSSPTPPPTNWPTSGGGTRSPAPTCRAPPCCPRRWRPSRP
jgi:hypothetical protein